MRETARAGRRRGAARPWLLAAGLVAALLFLARGVLEWGRPGAGAYFLVAAALLVAVGLRRFGPYGGP